MVDTADVDLLNLQQAEERLRHAVRIDEEADAMFLLAERDAEELGSRNIALRAENTRLRKRIGAKRSVRRELAEAADNADVYDWVCEITKLSDVGNTGWKVQYSPHFLSSMTEEERRFVVGIEPLPFSKSETSSGPVGGDNRDDEEEDAGEGSNTAKGWDGAVVAVLGPWSEKRACMPCRP